MSLQPPEQPSQPTSPHQSSGQPFDPAAQHASATQPTTPLPPHLGAGPQQPAPQQPVAQQPVPTTYQQQPARPALPTTVAQTNTFALISILTVFLQPIAGIVFGHLGLSQIKRTGDAGRGIALTGLILGYAYFVMIALFIVFYISMIALVFAGIGSMVGDFSDYGSYDPYYDESW